MFATALLPGLVVTVWRFYITESASWLFVRGQHERAEAMARRLLRRNPQFPKEIKLERAETHSEKLNYGALFNPQNLRATILASVPWFLQDLSTYGIGIFTPTLLAAAFGGAPDHIRSTSDLITKDILAAKGSALITSMLLVGITFAVILADRLGRIKLQMFGFVGCALGLARRVVLGVRRRLRQDLLDLRRRDALQFHDRPRSERANVSARRRSLSRPPSAVRARASRRRLRRSARS
jgi:putative MFS transporter